MIHFLLRVTLITLALLFMSSAALADDNWKPYQKSLAISFVALQAIDYGQTNYIFENRDRYYEVNPFVDYVHEKTGETGWLLYKALSTALVLYIADKSPKYRTWILAGSTVLLIGITTHNASIGLRLSF